MRDHHLLAPRAAALILALGACDDDDPVQPAPDPAMIRIVNVAEGSADVQVIGPGSTSPIATLDFGQTTTACVEVPAGDQSFAFSTGEDEIASVEAELEEGDRYLLVLVSDGAGADRRAVVASDEVTASAGNNALRFVNATGAIGDVYVTTPTDDPAAPFLVVDNLSPLAAEGTPVGEPAHRSTAHTRVRFFADGETTDPLADITMMGLPSSRLATVVLRTRARIPKTERSWCYPASDSIGAAA